MPLFFLRQNWGQWHVDPSRDEAVKSSMMTFRAVTAASLQRQCVFGHLLVHPDWNVSIECTQSPNPFIRLSFFFFSFHFFVLDVDILGNVSQCPKGSREILVWSGWVDSVVSMSEGSLHFTRLLEHDVRSQPPQQRFAWWNSAASTLSFIKSFPEEPPSMQESSKGAHGKIKQPTIFFFETLLLPGVHVHRFRRKCTQILQKCSKKKKTNITQTDHTVSYIYIYSPKWPKASRSIFLRLSSCTATRQLCTTAS